MTFNEIIVKIYKCMLDFNHAIGGDEDEYEAMKAFIKFDELLPDVSESNTFQELEDDLYYYRRLAIEILSLWADAYERETYDGDEIDLEYVKKEINIRFGKIWKLTFSIKPRIMRLISGILKMDIYDNEAEYVA